MDRIQEKLEDARILIKELSNMDLVVVDEIETEELLEELSVRTLEEEQIKFIRGFINDPVYNYEKTLMNQMKIEKFFENIEKLSIEQLEINN